MTGATTPRGPGVSRPFRGELRGMTIATLGLGLVLALAQWAWFAIGPDGVTGSGTWAHRTQLGVGLLAWALLIVAGLVAVVRRSARPVVPVAGAAAVAAAVAIVLGLVLMVLLGNGRVHGYGEQVLDQTWPQAVALLFAGEWLRQGSRATR